MSESSSLSFRDDNVDYLNQYRRVEAAKHPDLYAQSPHQSSSDGESESKNPNDDESEFKNPVVGTDGAVPLDDTVDGKDVKTTEPARARAT